MTIIESESTIIQIMMQKNAIMEVAMHSLPIISSARREMGNKL